MIRRWLRSPHFRPVAAIASGSAAAQVLGILVSPIITRLYEPSDFGAAAVFNSVVAIGSAIAALRYDAAIVLPSQDEDGEREALNLVRLSVVAAFVTSAVSAVILVALSAFGSASTLTQLGTWAFAIPIGIVSGSATLTLNSYATRRRDYGVVARIPLLRRVASSIAQLLGGFLHLGLSGLMIAALVTPFVGLRALWGTYCKGKGQIADLSWNWRDLRSAADRYSDFPRVSTWFTLMSALAWNIQAIVLARYYSISDVGQYALATSIVGLPTSMVLAGLSQVYLRECAARVSDRAAALALVRRTLQALFTVSVPIFVGVYLGGRYFFHIVFGPQWVLAGSLAVAMIPLLWARFLTTSISSTLNVYRRQAVLLVWQGVSLSLTVGALTFGGRQGWPIESTTWLTSFLVAPMYLLIIPLALRVIVTRSGGPS